MNLLCKMRYTGVMETNDLTLAEAARAVGVHVETLRRLARARQVETYIVNPGSRRSRFRVTPAALQAFRERGRRVGHSKNPDADALPFLSNLSQKTMTGAELIAYWEREGVFDAFKERAAQIGPGKQFADSTEYVQHLREQSAERTHE